MKFLREAFLLPVLGCSSVQIAHGAYFPPVDPRIPVHTKRFKVDLDVAPENRWDHVYSDVMFANATKDINDYFKSVVPMGGEVAPILEEIAGHLDGYFPPEYAAEMRGIAKAIKSNLGTIVLLNLVYQLEQIGLTCLSMNVTGPCPSEEPKRVAPSLCTSAIAESRTGQTFHGRNMDWNLVDQLLKYVISVDYYRGEGHIFTGTLISGMTGVLHGMVPSRGPHTGTGWTVSMNAREDGGNILVTLVTAMAKGGMTPTQLARQTLQNENYYDIAAKKISNADLVNPCYFIMTGPLNQGQLIARTRDGDNTVTLDLHEKGPRGNEQEYWFKLQTNYDFADEEPSYDARRGPGVEHIKAAGQDKVASSDGMWKVMGLWPTHNSHTDITAVMSILANKYKDVVWRDPKVIAVEGNRTGNAGEVVYI